MGRDGEGERRFYGKGRWWMVVAIGRGKKERRRVVVDGE